MLPQPRAAGYRVPHHTWGRDPRQIAPMLTRWKCEVTRRKVAEVTAFVYKVCPVSAWQLAELSGELAFSEADRRDGFVHLSTYAQLPGTLAKHFRGQSDLVLLAVPTERLATSPLRWELSRGGELFPHLYAPLRASVVSRVQAIDLDETGEHRLPEP